MPQVFISYRREDSADAAGRIKDKFDVAFGAESVFFDVDNIPPGVDFRTYLYDAVAKCDALLVIIGNDWLNMKDGTGRRRLDNPSDFVRIEIEAALERDVPVVPVLVGRAGVPDTADLPESIQQLAYRNASEVQSGPNFRSQVDRLVRGIKEYHQQKSPPQHSDPKSLGESRAQPPTTFTAPSVNLRRLVAAIIGGIFALSAIALTIFFQEKNNEGTKLPVPIRLPSASKTCWENVHEVGNVWTLCLAESEVTTKMIFTNATIDSPPTTCTGPGTLARSSRKWRITISDAKCDNGSRFGPTIECSEPNNTTMTCFSANTDKPIVFKKLAHVKDI